MKGLIRSLSIAAAIALLPAAYAGAAQSAKLLQPDITVSQFAGLPALTNPGGATVTTFQVAIHNPSSEPITLTRIELRSLSPVSAYYLVRDSRPYKVTIAPNTTVNVKYQALVNARGGLVGSMTPVDLQGVAWFTSPAGGFVSQIRETITPKSRPAID